MKSKVALVRACVFRLIEGSLTVHWHLPSDSCDTISAFSLIFASILTFDEIKFDISTSMLIIADAEELRTAPTPTPQPPPPSYLTEAYTPVDNDDEYDDNSR